jgi:hypothetical protein
LTTKKASETSEALQIQLVRETGIEPARRKALDPKSTLVKLSHVIRCFYLRMSVLITTFCLNVLPRVYKYTFGSSFPEFSMVLQEV